MEPMDVQPLKLDMLPNETVLEVIKYLDAASLVQCFRVCQIWYRLCNVDVLWKDLCWRTSRIIGELTFEVCNSYACKPENGWKKCYYWITKKDLQDFKDTQSLCEFASSELPLKRKYLFARGVELYPTDPTPYQYYAELLAERPDINHSWDTANLFYLKSLELSNKSNNMKNLKALSLYRYAVFLANQRQDIEEATKYYKKLLKLLPGNAWVFERYAEFLSELRQQHNLADQIFRLILNRSPSGSSLSTFAMFQWHIRKDTNLAGKFFKKCMEYDPEKIYFYVNFIARQFKDEKVAKQILQNSQLSQKVTEFLQKRENGIVSASNEEKQEDEQAVFSLALAYHQIHAVDEAEDLYRKHFSITEVRSIYTISNLAELLVHSRRAFDEAESLYKEGLEQAGGYNDVHIKIFSTIELALVGLKLARNEIEEGLPELARLLESPHIKCSRNCFTEGWILYYIHCTPLEKPHALKIIKQQLVTHEVRPKLVLMFDANIAWAKEHRLQDAKWIEKISLVYNCEEPIEALNEWEDWMQIEVSPPPFDPPVTQEVLSNLFESDDEEEEEQENVATT